MNAGVADEDIEAPECLDDLGRCAIDLLLIRDVHCDADGALAGGIDFVRGGVGGFLIEVRDGDLCAFPREDDGNFLSDAAGRTGHDCDFVL